jgi:hypothetical protein
MIVRESIFTYSYISYVRMDIFPIVMTREIYKYSKLKIKVSIHQKNKVVFQMYFEEGDDEILERGEYITSIYNIPFDFSMTDNISDC